MAEHIAGPNTGYEPSGASDSVHTAPTGATLSVLVIHDELRPRPSPTCRGD